MTKISWIAKLVTLVLSFASSSYAETLDPCKNYNKKCQRVSSAPVTVIDEVVRGAALSDLGDGVWWRATYTKLSSRYIRFLFDNIISAPAQQYTLRITTVAGRIVASYSSEQFGSYDSFSTGLLESGDLIIELIAKSKPNLNFRFSRAAWQRPLTSTQPESFVPEWHSIQELPDDNPIKAVAPSVVLIHIGPLDQATCTGILTFDASVVTNYHCMKYSWNFQHSQDNQKRGCRDVLIEFDYYNNGKPGPTTNCVEVFRSDHDLDVAILTLDPAGIPNVNGERRKAIAMRPSVEGLPKNVTILHYPLGLPLVYQSNCSIRGSDNTGIQHDCGTTSGSSGSPLLDGSMRWIATHFQGPYPDDWTVARIDSYIAQYGPSYNHARSAKQIDDLNNAKK